MSTENIQIRAKKISALDNYDKSIEQYGQYTYLIVGYNDPETNNKQNYKINLKQFLDLLSGGLNIDDEMLLTRIQNFISNGDIQLPTIQGPQGPQGPQGDGANFDASEIQSQMDELRRIINNYHNTFMISYSLINITGDPSNPLSISGSESATLKFTPDPGYKMPDEVSVTGCSKIYNASTKQIYISNATNNIEIRIIGEQNRYSLSHTFNNLNYEFLTDIQNSYLKNDVIRIKLTPISSNYILPETASSITYTNCLIDYEVNNNRTEAILTITCNATGNMTVKCSGVQNITYYFGFINDMNPDIVTITWSYDNTDTLNGVNNIVIHSFENWPSYLVSSTSCPFTISSADSNKFTITGIGRNNNVIFIVPKIFYNKNTSQFNNGRGTTGFLYPAAFGANYIFNGGCEFTVNGVEYVGVYMGESFNENATLIIK